MLLTNQATKWGENLRRDIGNCLNLINEIPTVASVPNDTKDFEMLSLGMSEIIFELPFMYVLSLT